MENALWARLPVEVRAEVDRLLAADRRIQAVAVMREHAGEPRPGIRECVDLVQERSVGTVVLMCGLPGAGKTTYAKGLERRGYVRLSIDEVVWERLGGRDAGVELGEAEYDALKEQVRAEQRVELTELMRAGRNVVVDYSFWSRAARDDYKALVESHGCRWELVYLMADRVTLEGRLAVRNRESGANAVTVDEALLARYLTAFEEPLGEGEQVLDSGAGAGGDAPSRMPPPR